MKKFIAFFCCCLLLFSFIGCNTAKIKVGVNFGVVYFHYSNVTPEIILKGEREITFEDKTFFEKLASTVEGKRAIYSACNCSAIYNVCIDEYTFGLHTHSITISYPMSHLIKTTILFSVDCTEEEMNELFDILESVKNNQDTVVF